MTDPDAITILCSGRELTGWTRFEAESHVLVPADAFSVELGALADGDMALLRELGDVQIRIGSETIFTGRIDEVADSGGAGYAATSIDGRDNAADLVDGEIPPVDMASATILQLARAACSGFGVAVLSETGAAESRTAARKSNPGETAWDLIDRYARKAGAFARMDARGRLVLFEPDYDQGPAFEIVRRIAQDTSGNNAVSWAARFSRVRYSHVTVTGRTEEVSHTATDSELTAAGIYRPRAIADYEIETIAAARTRAQREIALGRVRGLSVRYTLDGFRDGSGNLFAADTVCRVTDERLGLDEDLYVVSTRYACDETGRSTEVTVCRKGSLS